MLMALSIMSIMDVMIMYMKYFVTFFGLVLGGVYPGGGGGGGGAVMTNILFVLRVCVDI